MKSSRPLARNIRTIAREQLRASKLRWKDYKRLRRGSWRQSLQVIGNPLVLYPLLMMAVLVRNKAPDTPLAVIACYSIATVFGRAISLHAALYRSGDLAFFMYSPVSDYEFFQYTRRNLLRSSFYVWFYCVLVFTFMTYQSLPGRFWMVAIAAATLQWLVVINAVIVLELLTPRLKRLRAGLFFYPLILAIVLLPNAVAEPLKKAVFLLPTGWVPYVLDRWLFYGETRQELFIILTLLTLVPLPFLARRLARSYPSTELQYPAIIASPGAEIEDGDIEQGASEAAVNSRTLASHATSVGIGRTLEEAGWIERLAARCLTTSERAAAEFLCGGNAHWSARWLWGTKVAFVGLIVLFLPRVFPTWVPIFVGIVASMISFPVLGGYWLGMQLRNVGGKASPAYAGMPLSYRLMSQTLLKINLVRLASWSVCFLVYSGLLGWKIESRPLYGIHVGLVVLFFLIAVQPLVIAGQHSYGTNDSQTLNPQLAVALLLVLPLGFGCLACATLLFVALAWAPEEGRAFFATASATGLLACSSLVLVCHKWFYDHGRIDLLRNPRA